MIFTVVRLARVADNLDFSDITTARRIKPARWVGEGRLEITFDRDLTEAEVDAIRRRLTTPDAEGEQLEAEVEDYLDNPEPDLAAMRAQVDRLTRLVLKRDPSLEGPARAPQQ